MNPNTLRCVGKLYGFMDRRQKLIREPLTSKSAQKTFYFVIKDTNIILHDKRAFRISILFFVADTKLNQKTANKTACKY